MPNHLQPFRAPVRNPNYRIVDQRSVYAATWQGTPYNVFPTPEEQNRVSQCLNQGFDLDRSGPWTYNWAVRRSPCTMISGDLPRFALVETERNDSLNPPFVRMGDLRIRVTVGEDAFWLDERGQITTTYHPWGSVHRVNLQPKLPLTVVVTAALAENCGLAVRVDVEGDPANAVKGALDLYWGGLDINPTQYWQEYLRVHPQGYPYHVPRPVSAEDRVSIADGTVTLANSQVPVGAAATALPAVDPQPVDPTVWKQLIAVDGEAELEAVHAQLAKETVRNEHRVAFCYDFDTAGTVEPVRLLSWKVAAGSEPLAIARFDAYLADAQSYYDKLLDTVQIDTPDTYLNTAFNAALVNLDYVYEAPAWFEGVHEWNGYFSVNYQISAAISLGQLDRAREALLYFGERPDGPGGVYRPDGSLCDHNNALDGLTYYVLQLYRYWIATGDLETLGRVWDKTVANFERLLQERDPDGDLLLNWHASCNVFLYQADHLSLPGAAASPSIFATGMLEWMADMADALAGSGGSSRPSQAAAWRRRAAYMRREIVRRLWLSEESRFTSGIDAQGLVQKAAYYTDFVFPILYSRIPREYTLKSLDALDRTLWIGDHLLRTGNYQPDFFGNNAVHPTAMCEGAEAYFKAGRAERGWALLHGTALCATVLTDSPGQFPEYCTTTGYGLPDWIFGNDIGTYIRAVVGGLFGFERTAAGQPLAWNPCLPAEWETASLRLGSISMAMTGRAGERSYKLTLPEPQAVRLRLPLFGHHVDALVNDQGRALACESDGLFATVQLPVAKHHAITIRSTATAVPEQVDQADPSESLDVPDGPLTIEGPRHTLDLTNLFNAEALPPVNQGVPCSFDFSRDLDGNGCFAIGDTAFVIRPNGKNMVRIEVGKLVRDTTGFEPTDAPDAVTIPVGQAVNGIEFLCAGECRCRLTDMTVGAITLRYANGTETVEPLIVGKNVDCSHLPFAQAVHRRALSCDPVTEFSINPAAFAIPADPSRTLAAVEIRIIAADASIGLLAANVIEQQ